ncbi:hypothetical protein SAMN05428989_3486 [Pseudoxanthomonas sp. GM95]|uniref:hypothetical protein n=1 Tax=Pseudoxanthomonas sp. GM95 TaxID=1881043 RepID=UPI0008ADC2F5|nr:hypothetical protein [Pseudoxanthomonas sp. GM95]SEM24522.1 hypothetical protein SAMN05428989_3486 [Pseudoxanthomonas sp. GM95]
MLMRTFALLVFLLALSLLALCAIGLAHSALDSREWLLLADGAAGLILLPLSVRRLRARRTAVAS